MLVGLDKSLRSKGAGSLGGGGCALGISYLIIPPYCRNRKIIAKIFSIAEFTNQ